MICKCHEDICFCQSDNESCCNEGQHWDKANVSSVTTMLQRYHVKRHDMDHPPQRCRYGNVQDIPNLINSKLASPSAINTPSLSFSELRLLKLSNPSFLFIKIDLFFLERQVYREKQKQRSSIHWFTLQVVTTARAELIPSQEPQASSGSPMQLQGPKALRLPLLLSQAATRQLDGKWSSVDTY